MARGACGVPPCPAPPWPWSAARGFSGIRTRRPPATCRRILRTPSWPPWINPTWRSELWKIILATVIIFGAGVVVGGLLVQHIILDHPRNARRPGMTDPPPITRRRQPHGFVQTPSARSIEPAVCPVIGCGVAIDRRQHEAIGKLIHNGQEQNRSIWTNCSAQSQQVMQEVRNTSGNSLTPTNSKNTRSCSNNRPGRRAAARPEPPTPRPPAPTPGCQTSPTPPPPNKSRRRFRACFSRSRSPNPGYSCADPAPPPPPAGWRQ